MTPTSVRRRLPRTLLTVALAMLVTIAGIGHADARDRQRQRDGRADAAECVPGGTTNAAGDPCETEGPPGDPNCFDGIDNDDDGTIDRDGKDTDGDGTIDIPRDEDCVPDDTDPCSDGLDNEPGETAPDGKIDLEDSDCFGTEGPPGDPTCFDGIDNDGDGLIDFRDPDCLAGSSSPPPSPPPPAEPQPEEPLPCAHPTIVGTPGNDKIRGTRGADIIDGMGGDDKIRGKRGNDIICGASGNDKLRGGRKNDIVIGGAGDDKLRGGRGIDNLDGGPNFDVCKKGTSDPQPVNCEKIKRNNPHAGTPK